MGSLFAGIGGFDLGFERAGFKTVWQVEIDEYCRKVLARHFPDAERYEDIRECCGRRCYAGGERAFEGLMPPSCDKRHHIERVDVICGGFPCQDISNAGLRAGIDGERSGLWREMHRIVSELRPRYVVVENVAALLGRGMGRVLGDLSEIGYDAEWQVISAADVGAPHLRERIWIVAHDTKLGCGQGRPWGSDSSGEGQSEQPLQVADTVRGGCTWARGSVREDEQCGATEVSHAANHPENSYGVRRSDTAGQWRIEPNVGRVAHGVPARVDRLRALGNAVVPQIPELIARRLKEVIAQ
jgi:DNA (cytosine-5)-methyltransferase 1